ncbi:sirohydrochlorin chelatase [Nodularia spumigena CS-584]|jgi:sirohydrochlorin cobaltochelatase|uniref:Sirohydrochlorin chelatase n=1 Tax=Nodularia spumigena UHCC 0060 TaxID=3110300 RepID=A0ABU5UWJ3_NODSP|nr:sirohydrochlorin chelatase [Nodularia spumigena]AHJ28798.1 Sirohydrochlorin cobaltochelatase [Nodularia spumigena CCY9414]EAW43615.1 Cobalamin (vitamin B12) biosynthesis CbiX protein [Nodularia spumigena CCY9414]MDB9381718.1 sirohydrochlorin chelatase [Nodularia spumigena CS-584]MEA5525016.1 sirohydrochlorin chelatase [Nodularia spumigena UHCC 0143]MEA5558360.1 sirohydrochlorin chelatase [Nodularia spumigena CH309]
MPSAYLLVSHGSRDPRPAVAMQQLAEFVSQKLGNTKNPVGIAALELQPEPLHQQIQKFASGALVDGIDCLQIVPLFLLPGVHVMTDIPDQITLAQQALGQDIMINLHPHLGSHPSLITLLCEQMATMKAETTILLAHGSRRPGSLKPIETIAAKLGAVTAYWAVAPSLESRLQDLVAAGKREIAILPYFLFTGGITDAIAQSIEKLKLQFPTVTFQLAAPLGASAELAEIIEDLIHT